ncbi:MAG TPA: DUF485 domain-containing protein [Planctomycetaceae bacterium]|jgi:uncharacterized membrane protein (DUF485 family)|nr:DUF485 domain-containing protein [Planctomycetaceae bacterium]HCP12469.1 DUF485 domain-containing protein [Planctomycetaceae bacterium]
MKSDSSRYGLVLFFVYLLFYGGFVAINAIAPESMERTLVSGLNTAVVYGFALIFGAVLLSAVYGFLCGDVGRGGDAGGGEQ